MFAFMRILPEQAGTIGSQAKAKPANQVQTEHPRATLAASILGSSVAFIDGSVVNVALPALSKQLHAGAAELP